MAEARKVQVHSSVYDKAKQQTYSEDKYNAKGKLLHKKGSNIQEEFKKSMASGGGTPIGEGEASPKGYKDQNGRGAMQRIEKSSEANQERSGNQQPRTDDGQFTFNSAAGKGLSKKSDPTRNHTVNPLMVDGMNNIDKDEFLAQLKAGEGELYEAFGHWRDDILIGGKYAYQNKIYNIDSKSAYEEIKKITGKTGGTYKGGKFEKHGDIATTGDKGKAQGYDVSSEGRTKMGRRSKEEKEFIKNNKIAQKIFASMERIGDVASTRPNGPEFGQTKTKFTKDDFSAYTAKSRKAGQEERKAAQEQFTKEKQKTQEMQTKNKTWEQKTNEEKEAQRSKARSVIEQIRNARNKR